jgi:FKBP-type peptidyl-prolyl cis-trans isomerase (trigger factor)
MKIDVKQRENSEVELNVVLKAKDLEKYRDEVTKQAKENLEIDGFRKGKVPEDVAMKHINGMKILEEMAHRAISEKYIDIIKEKKIKAIGHPQVNITKIAEGSDLEFSIVTAVLPEISLGDYKKAAKEVNKKEDDLQVSEDEVTGALDNLRKMRAQQELMKKAQEEGSEEVPSWSDIKDEDLPEMDDQWAQSVGPFKTVEELTVKIKENLQEEKKTKAVDKKRVDLIDTILKDSQIDVPTMMVQHETDKMMHEFEHNISMTGMPFDEYLKSINKTKEDYRKEWEEQARKRAQTQLMLNHIAASEKIDPSDEDIEKEVAKILEQYKDNAQVNEQSVRSYVSSVLTHQKVFEYLENIK